MNKDIKQTNLNNAERADPLPGNIDDRCQEELSEFRISSRYLRKTSHLVFWLAVWSALSLVVIANGGASGYLISATAYLLVLLIVSVYLYATWQFAKRANIPAPDESNDASALFEYYYALDKRNDKISNAAHVSGAIIGIATIVLVVSLVALFAFGIQPA